MKRVVRLHVDIVVDTDTAEQAEHLAHRSFVEVSNEWGDEYLVRGIKSVTVIDDVDDYTKEDKENEDEQSHDRKAQ